MSKLKSAGEGQKVPSGLRKILSASPMAKARWDDLTSLAQRDFILWIDDAKQAETRKRRIESIPSRLASGKRRPCCFAIVPMPLYKALGANPKAKAQWKTLDSNERRNLIDWVNDAKDTETRKERIWNACELLEKGKRHP